MKFKHYVPLDEILAAPMTKILRALKRFDWAEREDLWFAIGYDLHYVDSPIRNCIAQTLLRLIHEGLVECRYHGGPVRITPAGLHKLDGLMRYDISEPANENGTDYTTSDLPPGERRRIANIKYRARMVAEGRCVRGRNHGPATQGQHCDSCYEKRIAKHRLQRESKQASNQ